VATEKVFLTRSWRMLSAELSVLLDNEEFCSTFKGATQRLRDTLEPMQQIAQAATVEMTPELQELEDELLKK
jgi:hypothetical protein